MQLSNHKKGEADTPFNSSYLCQNCARSLTYFKPTEYSKYEGLEDGIKALNHSMELTRQLTLPSVIVS